MSRRSNESESERKVRQGYGRNSRRKRKKKSKFPVLIIGLIVILALGFLVTEVINHYSPTKEKADLQSLYGASEGYASILSNHEWLESQALWEDGQAYMGYDVVRLEMKGRFFWDAAAKTLLYTMPEETLTFTADSRYENAPVLIEKDDTVYLSLTFVSAYTNINAEVFTEPNRVVLQTEFGTEKQTTVKSTAAVRVKGGIKSPIITTLESGSLVVVLEEFDNWTRIQTPDGWIGFIEKKSLNEVQEVTVNGPDREPNYSNISLDHQVCLVWQQSLNSSCLAQLETLLTEEAMDSVNTVSPTWFTIANEQGEITSRANPDYTTLAHENDLDVWPILENVNNPDVDMVELLSSTANRTKLIESVMQELENTGVDGLNVDLEDLPQAAGDGYIQLIRELSVECRKRGLVLSVDNMVPSAWTEYYNRREQGIVADYVIIMGYDEHYNGSEIGSTASLPYVQEAIENTIKDVPAEKVINGVPFYSRLWKESSTSVESEAIGMDGMQEFITNYNGKPEWNDDCAQNYVRVEDGDMIYQLWVEDVESMDARLKMMQNYDLAGVACWKQGMESQDVWSVFRKYYAKS